MFCSKPKMPPDRDPLDHLCSGKRTWPIVQLAVHSFYGYWIGSFYTTGLLVVMRQLAVTDNPHWGLWVGLAAAGIVFLAIGVFYGWMDEEEIFRETHMAPDYLLSQGVLYAMATGLALGVWQDWYRLPMIFMLLVVLSCVILHAPFVAQTARSFIDLERRNARKVSL